MNENVEINIENIEDAEDPYYLKPPSIAEDDPIIIEKERLVKLKQELDNKTQADLEEEIFEFIDCDEPARYRKKIKGFQLPFSIRDKVLRIPESEKQKLRLTKKGY